MTDFLTRIAERTLVVAPVAQPIIAPLFAPGPAIPASAPASLEIDEMQEAPLPVQKARPSIPRPVPLSPITRTDEEPTIASGQPSPRTIGKPISTQASKLLSSQQEEQITHVADTRTISENITPASPARYSLHETSIRSNLVNEPVPPAPIASIPPSPIEEIKEVPATSARHVPVDQQPVSRLIDTQATPLETHENIPVTPSDEHNGEKRTVPPAQSVNTPPGSVRIDYVPLASEPHFASPQVLIQEVTEIREVQGIVSEQQDTSSHETTSKPMQRLPETTSLSKRGSTPPGEQGLLVPHEPGRSDRQEPQSVGQQQVTDLTISYEHKTALPGKQTITTLEQHIERPSEQHPMDVTEPSATTPTIRVTIGRIDVRAVTSSEATTRPKPTRAAPRITLEDYARQNKRGGG